MYDRVRHLDLTGALENIAFVSEHLVNGGSTIPDEWRVSIVLSSFYCLHF